MTNDNQRITAARTALLMQQPFFGTLALYLEPVASEKHQTFATDGQRLFFNPTFLETLSEQELMGTLAHEVMHLALRHHTRRGARDPKLWNTACDYAVNPVIRDARLKLPPCALLDARYEGFSAEQIYTELQRQSSSSAEQQQGEEDQDQWQGEPGEPGEGDQPGGSGEGAPEPGEEEGAGAGGQGAGEPTAGQPSPDGTGSGDPGGCGEILDAADGPAELGDADAVWEARVRQAVNVARAGTGTGGTEAVIKHLAKPSVDWREELRAFINDRSRTDFSWKQPNKRLLPSGFMLPGLVKDGVAHLGIGLDTSGSIYDNPRALAMFREELQAMLDEGSVERLTVVHCDCEVRRVEEFQSGNIVELHPIGGGGTAFEPVFEWFKDKEPEVSAIVYFTDMEGSFGQAPEAPVLWAKYGLSNTRPPFGAVVELIDGGS